MVSNPRKLEIGFPHGSILGPLLFTPSTAPTQDIISAHNLNCMFDADYSQLYVTIYPLSQYSSEVHL